MRWLVRFCVLAWFGLWGCGGARSPSTPPAALADETPLSDSYGTLATQGVLVGDAADATLREALTASCRAAGLATDGRLARLAEALAHEAANAGHAPDLALMSYHAQRLGLVEPTPELWLGYADTASAIAPGLRAAVQEAARGAVLTHSGGAAVRGGPGVVTAVVFVRRRVSFAAPIPHAFASGDALHLSGQLVRGFHHPVLAITDPSGNVAQSELGPGRSFEHSLAFGQRGEHTLELLANGPEGMTVVALFRVAVGTALSLKRPSAAGPVEHDAESMTRNLMDLVARERKQRGLAALTPHAGLERVARAHGEDMRAHHFVAHISPSTGAPSDRVRRAGIASKLLLENVGRGYSAQELHAGLMASPGHRANILHPDVRALGVGVVSVDEGEGGGFLATQLFAQLAEPVRWATAQADLFDAISLSRHRRKLGRVRRDSTLSRLAMQIAEAYARDPGVAEQTLFDEALRGIHNLPAGAELLTGALAKADDLAQVAENASAMDPRLVTLGIGIAPLPKRATHSLVVVLLLANHR